MKASEFLMAFEAQGAIVPFAHPRLRFTRVRRSEEYRLEALLPSLIGGREIYVLAWPALMKMYVLDIADRMLIEEIAARGDTNPIVVHKARLTVARLGAFGAEAQSLAKAQSDAAQTHEIQVYFSLIENLRTAFASTEEAWELPRYDLKSRETQNRINLLVQTAAKSLDKPKTEIISNLEVLAEMTGPMVQAGSSQGRMLVELLAMKEFMKDVARARLGGDVETQTLMTYLRLSGNTTLSFLSGILGKLADLVEKPSRLLTRWDQGIARVEEYVLLVSWALNGWSELVGLWTDSRGHSQLQIAALEQIAPNVPFLPPAITAAADSEQAAIMERFKKSFVSVTGNWISGDLNGDMVDLMRARG